jgi:ketosteroid isomerase-like protein
MRTLTIAVLALSLAIGTVACAGSAPGGSPSVAPTEAGSHEEDAELIRAAEEELIAALLAGDIDAVGPLLADDFELIDPAGDATSRAQVLEAVESGSMEYQEWTVDSPIEVRVHGDAAAVRFQSTIKVKLNGATIPGEFWHTDFYVKSGGRWLMTWAQTTQIL